MSKRSYTHINLIEEEIIAMREAGKSRREIAEHFGLEIAQIKWWINRYNRKRKKLEAGIVLSPKGRPRKDGKTPQQKEKTELERLRMENKLLRDFLQLTGRK